MDCIIDFLIATISKKGLPMKYSRCRLPGLSGVCLILTFTPGLPAARTDGISWQESVESLVQDEHALWLGRRVLAVKAAIHNPEMPGAMEAILVLGLDSRYYVMVRGWLAMQLRGDLSILEAGRGTVSQEIAERIEFLRKAIRAIDLE